MLHANPTFLNFTKGPILLKSYINNGVIKSSRFFTKFFEAEDQGSIPNYSCNFLFPVSFLLGRLFSPLKNYVRAD